MTCRVCWPYRAVPRRLAVLGYHMSIALFFVLRCGASWTPSHFTHSLTHSLSPLLSSTLVAAMSLQHELAQVERCYQKQPTIFENKKRATCA